MQGIESGTWQSIVLLESSLFLYQCDFSFFCSNQELLYIRQKWKTNNAELNQNTQDKKKSEADSYTKGKRQFQA